MVRPSPLDVLANWLVQVVEPPPGQFFTTTFGFPGKAFDNKGA